ncbi:MAG TPA: ABC transporter substrate-binding protein [Candidatus Binatia bacterium]|nr:ABC transporter substrate-binding protein [Candidatus Binatia bacterium]
MTTASLGKIVLKHVGLITLGALIALPVKAQQLPEVTIVTAVNNMAFSAVWVAEQLKFFEQDGVRVKISVAGGGAPCQTSVVGRSTNFCASSSEGLVLAQQQGASLIAVQSHNRNITVGITVRKAIADKFKLTRKSPLNDRLRVLTQLGTIGATSPGAISEQIFKFLVKKIGADSNKLKFVYLGGAELVPALANNVIDGMAQSPPQAESSEASGKGYVLIPLSLGEVPEIAELPYLVLMARPDWAEQNSATVTAVARAISRGGALFHTQPEQARAALRAHRFSDAKRLDDNLFDLAYSMVVKAIPPWGNMNEEGWKKVISFSTVAGIIKDPSKSPSTKEGVLWTNKYLK